MSETRQELVNVVRQVRNRWRQRMLLRGGIIFLVGAIVAIALASYGLQAWKFSPQSVTWLRVGVFSVFALLANPFGITKETPSNETGVPPA